MKMTVRAFCLGAALLTAAACGSRDTKETRLAKGDALMAEGKVGEALIEYQTAVQLDGRDGTARHKLATAFIKAGDLGKALEQVVRAADLMPDNADVQLDAATALLKAAATVVVVVVVVGGAWLTGFMVVAKQMFDHRAIMFPLFCSASAGFAAAGVAGYLVYRVLR